MNGGEYPYESYPSSRYGRGGMNAYEPRAPPPPMPMRDHMPMRGSRPPRYAPDSYYGGNNETNAQSGGKKRKSKKTRRSIVDYGSMMLYGGEQDSKK